MNVAAISLCALLLVILLSCATRLNVGFAISIAELLSHGPACAWLHAQLAQQVLQIPHLESQVLDEFGRMLHVRAHSTSRNQSHVSPTGPDPTEGTFS